MVFYLWFPIVHQSFTCSVFLLFILSTPFSLVHVAISPAGILMLNSSVGGPRRHGAY